MMSTRRNKRTPRIDYRASWMPVITAANARLKNETVMHTNAFGTFKIECLVWDEQMGISYQVGTGFNQRTFVADMNWAESLAGVKMERVYA